ncbi:hypothetical protein ABT061_15580 [Streptosporangium sp. NPDC002544]|uniref:hypothetical protein n=1 Tax=Streptosporangium sp. NPDC002544 TaxID=3154538 RepID=UPI0033254AD7
MSATVHAVAAVIARLAVGVLVGVLVGTGSGAIMGVLSGLAAGALGAADVGGLTPSRPSPQTNAPLVLLPEGRRGALSCVLSQAG